MMFGVLRGSSCQFKHTQRQAWQGHLCGLCLSLRDDYGHLARLATNYDAAVLSALVEAQSDEPPKMYQSNCPLRRERKATITAPDSVGTQFAAAIALIMAATKVQDHVADGETGWRYFPNIARSVSQRWLNKGEVNAQRYQFDVQSITQQTKQQTFVELQPHQDFYAYALPTELAVGAAFRHTAVLAQKPHNETPLFEIGRLFGRIMYLLDSLQDLASDVAHNKFNALYTAYDEADILPKATKIFQQAHHEIEQQLQNLVLPRPELIRLLFGQQLQRRGQLVLSNGGADPTDEIEDLKEEEKRKKKQKVDDSSDGILPNAHHDDGFLHGCSYMYCDCGDLDCGDGLCGCDVCDCDACDCDGNGSICDCGDGCDIGDCGDCDCG